MWEVGGGNQWGKSDGAQHLMYKQIKKKKENDEIWDLPDYLSKLPIIL